MAWIFAHDAPPGARVLKRFFGVTVWNANMWFCEDLNKWMTIDEVPAEFGASSHARCNSFKAFKRHLRKHPELRGQEVELTSVFEGCNITARWYDIED